MNRFLPTLALGLLITSSFYGAYAMHKNISDLNPNYTPKDWKISNSVPQKTQNMSNENQDIAPLRGRRGLERNLLLPQ